MNTSVFLQNEARFDSAQHEITITAQSGGFWITGIYFNQMAVDLGDVDISKPNFTLNTSEFQLKRINGNTLIFTMTENTSGVDRRLLVSLHSGDYFDGVNIYQSK